MPAMIRYHDHWATATLYMMRRLNTDDFIALLSGKGDTSSCSRIWRFGGHNQFTISDSTVEAVLMQSSTTSYENLRNSGYIYHMPRAFAHSACFIPYISEQSGAKIRRCFQRVKATVAEWSRYRIVAGLFTSSSPVLLKTRRVGQRCTLNLKRAETSSRWCDVIVRREKCQLRCHPRHLTMAQNYVDLIISSHGHLKRTTSELAPNFRTSKTHQREDFELRQI
ncbi:uncharacterized protein TNCV_4839091 [Trichonephila clavipes]|nr:uncharacterized protein TNCV_4839091 [Trichonephila clavipes]